MQNNLLRKGRELCSRLDVFVKKVLPVFILLAGHCVTKAQTTESDFSFNDGIRYSQWVINSRINSFNANTTSVGFAVYDDKGNQTKGRIDGKSVLDYVPGLVAKGIIEASQYYSQYDWAQAWAKPWFLSIKNYGDDFCNKYNSLGGSLDDLNAAKLYLPLRDLSATGGKYADATTYGNTTTALDNAVTGLKKHNTDCVIKSGTTAETEGYDVTGGWWHKTKYNNQMWLDGQYMGGVLLAQLINYKGSDGNIIGTDDWDIAVKQLNIVWNMCWNGTYQLMYHAFDANAGDKTLTDSHSETWAGLNSKEGIAKYQSSTYWGRACGWYFLALVDMLEEMDKAGISKTDKKYTTIKNHLNDLAAGLNRWKDKTTGGWYQILDEDGTFSASTYNNGASHSKTYNYIESSATAIFAAGYLKALRLGYIDTKYEETAKAAYQCLVSQFFAADGKEGVHIFGSCRSAGLGESSKATAGNTKYRNGTKEYYLLGSDVGRVGKDENITEGKVLGAFILAATEYERQYQANKEILFEKDLAPSYDLTTGTTTAISMKASGSGTPAYQWYNEDGTKVEGATSSTFSPPLSGTYYCEASCGGTTITSSKTYVTVKEKEQPEDPEKDKIEGETEVKTVGETTATTLFYTDFTENGWSNASTDDKTTSTTTNINGTTITVTGKNITFDTKKGTATMPSNMGTDKNYLSIPIKGINGSVTIEITGDANSKFRYSVDASTAKSPSTNKNSTTNINNSEISTATVETDMTDAVVFIGRNGSNTIKSIKITTPGTSSSSYTTYTYRVATNYKTPTLNNPIRYIKDVNDNNKTLVSMKFGGWKHNEGTYNNGSGSVTDNWAPAKENSTGLDNFNVCFTGTNDAKDETKENFKEGEPFTLPVRGAFMAMEPTKNGKITAYVMHSGDFYATNQCGTVLKKAETGTGDVVKYEFDVKAGETYYLFSNTSAMSFCGASFIPDETQPSSTIGLSDTKAYTETANAAGYATITLNRTLKTNQWNTLTLPFYMTEDEVKTAFGDGTQIIILNKAETAGSVANLQFVYHEIQNILAGYPYLIKPKAMDAIETIESITVNGKHLDTATSPISINCGNYTAKGTPGYSTADVKNASGTSGYSVQYTAGDIFLSDGNGKLYVSQGSSYGKGYRSYIEKNNNGTAAAKSITMSMTGVDDGDQGTTTSISFTELAPEAIQAIRANGVYNLNGQKVANTTDGLPKGIYIVNGQKTIVK